MENNIIQVVLSIQVQFLFGEQGNKQIIFREQESKRKIILGNKAIYFRGPGADFSGEQGNRYPPWRASFDLLTPPQGPRGWAKNAVARSIHVTHAPNLVEFRPVV